MMTLAYTLGACLAGTFLSLGLAAVVAFRVQARWIPTLVSFAVGALLGAAFLDLLPHIFETARNTGRAAVFILLGILVFFMLEKLLLWRHHHNHGDDGEAAIGPVHEHANHDGGRTGWMIVLGDSFHNFTDGIIIAGAFLADVKIGIVTALAIIAHEIPQEIGDFLVLLNSGFTRRKALALNAMSGLAAAVGALLGYFALSAVSDWIPEILSIAAASMIYIAVADLIPGLHKRTELGESLVQVIFIALGIGCIWLIHVVLFPGA